MLDRDVVGKSHFGGFGDEDAESDDEDGQVIIASMSLGDKYRSKLYYSLNERNRKPRLWPRS